MPLRCIGFAASAAAGIPRRFADLGMTFDGGCRACVRPHYVIGACGLPRHRLSTQADGLRLRLRGPALREVATITG
jgi:hypothetical protein